jgi:hypothetical protein
VNRLAALAFGALVAAWAVVALLVFHGLTQARGTGVNGERPVRSAPKDAHDAGPVRPGVPAPVPRLTPRATRSRPLLNWPALAACESTSNPRAVSPSGRYRGLYQFNLPTWRSVGGHGDPAAATPAEQTLRAQMLYAKRGTQPWPKCGRHLRSGR